MPAAAQPQPAGEGDRAPGECWSRGARWAPLPPQLTLTGCAFLPRQDCSYFNSNAVPLKLSFQNVDPLGENIRVIFKVSPAPLVQPRPRGAASALPPGSDGSSPRARSAETTCGRTC